MITLMLEIEPIAKGRPRFWNGRAVTDANTRRYEAEVKARAKANAPASPLTGALTVSVLFTLPKPRSVKREHPSVRPDLDNLTKAILDALNGIYWKDDGQIVNLNVRKIYGTPPGVFVVVYPGPDQLVNSSCVNKSGNEDSLGEEKEKEQDRDA